MLKLKLINTHYLLTLILSLSWTSFIIFPIQSSKAENFPLPSNARLELGLLEEPKESVVTASTIAPQGLTVPSFWWMQQTTPKKLLDNWIAYPKINNESPRVDLIVNQQIWSLLDYLERYKFVNQVGTTARNFGYNLRIFNYQEQMLATYTCNFNISPEKCNIQMGYQSRLGFFQSQD
jgi:hypothetical protein